MLCVLCVGPIAHPEECGVSESHREASTMRRPWTSGGGLLRHKCMQIVLNAAEKVSRKEFNRKSEI